MERQEREKIAYYESIRKRIEDKIAQIGENLTVNLEIGSHGWPTFRLSNQDRNLADNELYLDIEIDREISEMAKMWEEEEKNYISINADAREMPFIKDSSVDKIMLANVIGYPDVGHSDSLIRLLNELSRILKPGGIIVITEDLTPGQDYLRYFFRAGLKEGSSLDTKFGVLKIKKYSQEESDVKEYNPDAFMSGYSGNFPFQLIIEKE